MEALENLDSFGLRKYLETVETFEVLESLFFVFDFLEIFGNVWKYC